MSHKFKVGDRVRIVRVYSCPSALGKEATVSRLLDGEYRILVDGICNPFIEDGSYRAGPEQLEPLINPDEQAWIAFRDLHLKPDPALIMAKEPAKEEA